MQCLKCKWFVNGENCKSILDCENCPNNKDGCNCCKEPDVGEISCKYFEKRKTK
jgi:hypothetical protein